MNDRCIRFGHSPAAFQPCPSWPAFLRIHHCNHDAKYGCLTLPHASLLADLAIENSAVCCHWHRSPAKPPLAALVEAWRLNCDSLRRRHGVCRVSHSPNADDYAMLLSEDISIYQRLHVRGDSETTLNNVAFSCIYRVEPERQGQDGPNTAFDFRQV